MAIIYLRGIGQKEVSNQDAKVIKQQWENNMLKHDEIISFGNFACKAGSITGITLEPETKDNNHGEEIDNNYYTQRHVILSKTPEERAERVEFYKLFIKIMDDRDVTLEEIEQVKKVQKEFFESNPFRMMCDLNLFKPFTKGKTSKIGTSIHILERVIQTDRSYEKYKMCV